MVSSKFNCCFQEGDQKISAQLNKWCLLAVPSLRIDPNHLTHHLVIPITPVPDGWTDGAVKRGHTHTHRVTVHEHQASPDGTDPRPIRLKIDQLEHLPTLFRVNHYHPPSPLHHYAQWADEVITRAFEFSHRRRRLDSRLTQTRPDLYISN